MLQRLRFSIVDFKKLKSTACPLISSQPQQRSQSRSIALLRQRLRGSELFRVLDRNAIRFHLAYTSRFVLTRILLSRLAHGVSRGCVDYSARLLYTKTKPVIRKAIDRGLDMTDEDQGDGSHS